MDIPLNKLKVLVLDCQATGGSPQKGHLLEIGWTAIAADRLDTPATTAPQSYLLRPPQGHTIPAAVTRVTGISTESLVSATCPHRVWQLLNACARETAAAAGREACPTVIHFARYEIPFLKALNARFAAGQAFRLQVVCTHEIARRLLPGLPRKGLRAVAGYFGHSVDSRRRSSAHVSATALIWRHLVQQLGSTHSIDSWEALRAWLDRTAPPQRTARSYPLNPTLRQKLPDLPGIYRMRRSNGDLLYVGKATSLKKRVNSYFRPKARHPEHTLEMLSQARRLDVTPTATSLEAAVLECDQIKQHGPPYNVALTEAERRLTYCSHDLSRSATSITDRFPVGPFPSTRTAESLAALSRWWTEPIRTSADVGFAILNLPQPYQPPAECALEGLALFYRTHAEALAGKTPLRSVTALGARFWQHRLAAAAEKDARSEDEPADDTAPQAIEQVWTPEGVQRTIEHLICHAAHMLRRARWFCLLSESNLLWETRAPRRPRRLIEIRHGRLVQCGDHQPGGHLPVPAGHRIPLARRGRHQNLATYDRLRVLTTEIRRLAADGRYLAACLGPGRILGRDQLRQLLKWI